MASDYNRPFDPLRPGKEVVLDETGENIMPTREIGISLAGTIEKLQSIWRRGRENHLFVIDRTTQLEEGFAFNTKDNAHWIIVLTRKMKMKKTEYISKLNIMKTKWKHLGRYIKGV